jgi:hypothetical protein
MPEKKPKVFIGSSREGLEIAQAIGVNLQHEAWCIPWPTAFPLSTMTIDTLIAKFHECEFAVFVFRPDDKIEIRDTEYSIARDNVIFEAGLFMGIHGRDKCYIITPMGAPDYRIPTDLYGFTPAYYDTEFAKQDALSALNPASTLISIAIKAAGGRRLPLTCETKFTFYEKIGISYPLKLLVILTNTTSELLVFKDLEFRPNSNLHMATDFDEVVNTTKSNPKISLYPGQELRVPQVIVEPSKKAMLWIPFETSSKNDLQKLVTTSQAGSLNLNVVHVNSGRVENISLSF